MSSRSSLVFFLVFFLLHCTAFAAEMNLRPKLAFAPFLPKNVEAMGFAENLSSLLYNSIDRAAFFEIIERRKIEGTIELEGLRIDNLTREDLLRVGRRAGLDFIVYGSVKRINSSMAVEIELLNIRTSRSSYYESFATADYEITEKLRKVAADIVAKADGSLAEERGAPQGQKMLTSPADLEITGAATKLKLKWTPPEGGQVAGFRVFRASGENGPFAHIATCTEPNYTDGGLKVNETFYYRLKAVGWDGKESDYSKTVIGRTSIAPHPPILLNIVPLIKGARLFFRSRPVGEGDNVNKLLAAGFKVYRKAADEKDFLEIGRCPKEESVFKDRLKENVLYTYALTSVNSDNVESEFSTQLNVTPLPPVSGVRVEGVLKRYVTLQWEASLGDDVYGYAVYRSALKDTGYEKVAEIAGKNSVSFRDLGPEACKSYWYRVTAFNTEGTQTLLSEPVKATTEGKLPVPAGFAAAGGLAKKISLLWLADAVPDGDVTGYFIYRAEEEKGPFTRIGEASRGKTSFTDDARPLTDNKRYYYRISSHDSTGFESDQAGPVSAVTKNIPKTPGNLKAVLGEAHSANLSWDANPEKDIKAYEIYRALANEKSLAMIGSVKETSYVDNGLQDGLNYIYAVKAIDEDGLASEVTPAVTAVAKPLPKLPIAEQGQLPDRPLPK